MFQCHLFVNYSWPRSSIWVWEKISAYNQWIYASNKNSYNAAEMSKQGLSILVETSEKLLEFWEGFADKVEQHQVICGCPKQRHQLIIYRLIIRLTPCDCPHSDEKPRPKGCNRDLQRGWRAKGLSEQDEYRGQGHWSCPKRVSMESSIGKTYKERGSGWARHSWTATMCSGRGMRRGRDKEKEIRTWLIRHVVIMWSCASSYCQQTRPQLVLETHSQSLGLQPWFISVLDADAVSQTNTATLFISGNARRINRQLDGI